MWPGWASLSLPWKEAFARARRTAEGQPARAGDRRAGTVTPEDPVPGHPGPEGKGGHVPSDCERRTATRLASAPSLFPPARRGAGAASRRGAALRLLLLFGRLNRDFVKRDR